LAQAIWAHVFWLKVKVEKPRAIAARLRRIEGPPPPAMLGAFFSWLEELLCSFGLLSRKNAKICFLGLDNAGKTTLLHMLRNDRVSINNPTVHPTNEELVIHGVRFRTFDLGGHETARRIWRDYLAAVDGIVFVVDAADRTRFAEAREELNRLLEDRALFGVPFAVLGNKIDIPVAASEDELRMNLGLYPHMTCGRAPKHSHGGSGPVKLFMVSVVRRMGYSEAFAWLAEQV